MQRHSFYMQSFPFYGILFVVRSLLGDFARGREGTRGGEGRGIVDFVQFREFPLKINDLRHPPTSPLTQSPKFPKISNRSPLPERLLPHKTP